MLVPRRGNYVIRRRFEHHEYACTENIKRHTSLQWNGSILSMFHQEFCFYYDPHPEAFTQNKGICGLPNAKECGRPCHDLSLGLVTKAKAWKAPSQKCNPEVTFALPGM
jgi:hypothetical protein